MSYANKMNKMELNKNKSAFILSLHALTSLSSSCSSFAYIFPFSCCKIRRKTVKRNKFLRGDVDRFGTDFQSFKKNAHAPKSYKF